MGQDTTKTDSILVSLPKVKPTTLRIADKSKISISSKIDQYKLRKYSHVAKLYQEIAASTIELCVNNKVPPAAILSIVSLESGRGSGYIGQITGNILSLNAVKGNA